MGAVRDDHSQSDRPSVPDLGRLVHTRRNSRAAVGRQAPEHDYEEGGVLVSARQAADQTQQEGISLAASETARGNRKAQGRSAVTIITDNLVFGNADRGPQ